jgi:hypothetical protein
MTPDQAIELIGEEAPENYALDLAAHADRYQNIPALATLLRSARLRAIRLQFEQANDAAAAAQTRYKTNMGSANMAVLIAATLSGLMMAAQIAIPIRGTVLVLGILSALSGAAATMWLSRVRQGNMLDTWMQRRAEAETRRLSYFNVVTEPNGANPPDTDLDLLRLEYFRRYQLDVQKNFYQFRGDAHRAAADKTLDQGSLAVALSALASLLTAGFGSVYGFATALGVVGVLGAALSSYAGSREALSQDRRNGERYARTRTALGALEEKLDEVRKAVAAGNAQALKEFASAVNEQVSLEHRQWLEATEAARTAVAKLDEALAKTHDVPPPAPAAPKPATQQPAEPAAADPSDQGPNRGAALSEQH